MSSIDSRRVSRQILGELRASTWKSLVLIAVCLTLALLGAFYPEYEGLSEAGRATLFILIFCALLWVTEALPAFAVSLLVIGLEIAILGKPGGVFAETPEDWQRFIAPWGSPLIWLFFGGFVLAQAAEQTGLDRRMALGTLAHFGKRPAVLLLGCMATTAVLSMFMSNTATATLMVAALSPMIGKRHSQDPMAKALLLGIAFAANIGGMGTVIGSPPNAIAAGALMKVAPVDFAQWMLFAVPPVIILLGVAWGFITLRYLGRDGFVPQQATMFAEDSPISAPIIKQLTVVITFLVTISLWISSPWHGIPTTVVAILPICVLTATSVLGPDEVRRLPWDVLLLIAGGLALGVGIADTGLATWIVAQLPLEQFTPFLVVLAFCYLLVILSNLMSNTAATNMVVPLVLAALASGEERMVVPIALCASMAMCLPISTPPNAIVYGTRRLATTDLMIGGLLLGAISPPLIASWSSVLQKLIEF